MTASVNKQDYEHNVRNDDIRYKRPVFTRKLRLSSGCEWFHARYSDLAHLSSSGRHLAEVILPQSADHTGVY